jgi:acetylornithine deacetylase
MRNFDGWRPAPGQSGPRLKAEFAVIGEPTGLQPIYAHKGFTMLRISLLGQSGHSSNPALGHNALEAMHQVLGALLAFRDALGQRYQDPGFEVSRPTLNLGCLHAGDNPNRICGHADLDIDIRMLPSMDNDQVREDLKALVQQTVADRRIDAKRDRVKPAGAGVCDAS